MNVFGMIAARNQHNAQSLRIAAQNIANLNTSGYKAQKATPLTFEHALGGVQIACTHPAHLGKNKGNGNMQSVEDPDGIPSLTGNTVSYAHELQKANQANNWDKQMHMVTEGHLEMLSLSLKT